MCKSFAKARGSHVAQTTSWLPIWRTRAGPPSSSNPWHKHYTSRDGDHTSWSSWQTHTNTRQTGLVVPVDLKLSIGIFVVRLVNTEVTGIQCLHLAISKLIKTIWNFRDISWSTQQILTRKVFKLVHNLDSIDSTANSKPNFRENMRKLCSQGLTLSSSQGCNDVGQERISSHHGLCIISVPDIQGTLSSFDNEWQRTLITNNLSIILTIITIYCYIWFHIWWLHINTIIHSWTSLPLPDSFSKGQGMNASNDWDLNVEGIINRSTIIKYEQFINASKHIHNSHWA